MGRFTSLFIMAFLLLTLSMATGLRPEPTVAEAKMRMCEAPSQRFKGPCIRESNCASVCQTEHFYGGDCRGLRRRCFCTKPC